MFIQNFLYICCSATANRDANFDRKLKAFEELSSLISDVMQQVLLAYSDGERSVMESLKETLGNVNRKPVYTLPMATCFVYLQSNVVVSLSGRQGL